MTEVERTAAVGTARRCAAVLALLALPAAFPGPASAVTELYGPSVSPNPGTTATTFTITVGYRSQPEERPAQSVSVEIVGLGGGPQAMTLVSGTATDGTWRLQRTLPAGSWDLVFRAAAQGSDPPPLDGPTVVVTPAGTPAPTASPTATATPGPSPRPTPRATPRPTPRPPPRPTARPTPRPTPRPPGVTPAPTAPGTTATDAPTTTASPVSSGAPRPTSGDDGRASTAPTPGSSPDPNASTPPTATDGDSPDPSAGGRLDPDDRDAEVGGGLAQVALIAIGGLVSTAGALVIARGWWRTHR